MENVLLIAELDILEKKSSKPTGFEKCLKCHSNCRNCRGSTDVECIECHHPWNKVDFSFGPELISGRCHDCFNEFQDKTKNGLICRKINF